MMKKVLVSVCTGAIIALSSCGSSRQVPAVTSIDGEWNIIEMNGEAVVPASGQEFPYIGFNAESGRLYGHTGCNRLNGSFDRHAKPGMLTLGNVGSTRMMCPDMSLEQRILTTLEQVKKYRMAGDDIALYGSSSRHPLLILQKRAVVKASDLNGRWTISQVMSTDVPEGLEETPFLILDATAGTVRGNAGCNQVSGAFEADLQGNGSIRFQQMACTMRMCPDMALEQKVLQAIEAATRFAPLDKQRMAFYNARNEPVLILVRTK